MKAWCARIAAGVMLLVCLARSAPAQDLGMPSLLPLPPAGKLYPVRSTAARDALWYQPESSVPGVEPEPLSPSDLLPPPLPGQPPSSKAWAGERGPGGWGPGGWDGEWIGSYPGGSWGPPAMCGPTCCPHSHYVYANALGMTKDMRSGFVTSIDSVTFDPVLLYCHCLPEFGERWNGGLEIGGGWCFGCDCNSAVEAVYWGLFGTGAEAMATGQMDSMIQFSHLDYQGNSVHGYFTGAAAHRILYDFDFHSAEIHLIGNNCCGGPLGCGRCGCSALPHRRLGFGWMAGFRYLHFSEDWLFSTDRTHTVFDGSANELHYEVDVDNNLFGFQIGAGLNACLTKRLQAVAVGRVGVYGNSITQYQTVYGSTGNAVLNSGAFAGQDYVIRSNDTDLAVAGQIDVGGRWAISPHWSFDFGYRVLGIAGVAIVEDNVTHQNFQNVLGTADTQTGGSVLLHGGYLGLTYCW